MARPNLNLNTEKLIHKIRNNGVRPYQSQAEVIAKALALLWKEEKSLALIELNQKKVEHYNENPEELEFNRKITVGN